MVTYVKNVRSKKGVKNMETKTPPKLCKFVKVIKSDDIFITVADIEKPKNVMKIARLDIDRMRLILIKAQRTLKANEIVIPARRIAHLLYGEDEDIRKKSAGTYLRPTGLYSKTHNWVLRYLMSMDYLYYYPKGDVELLHKLKKLDPRGIPKRGIDRFL